jgi:outer membrane protein assembly factor BamB
MDFDAFWVRVYALPQALLVSVVEDRDAVGLDGHNPDTTTYVYDPADGRLRWKYAWGATDDEVFHDRVLVQTSAKTGVTTAYDWVSGAVRWTLPSGSGRPVKTIGMGAADDSTQASFTDNRRRAGAEERSDPGTGHHHRHVNAGVRIWSLSG